MALRAAVRVEADELLLGRTLRAVPSFEFELEPQHTEGVVLFSVLSPEGQPDEFAHLEEAMDVDPTVSTYRVMVGRDPERVYAIEFDLDRRLLQDVSGALGINVLSNHSPPGDTGWTFQLEVPDREALRDLRRFCEDEDIGFELRRLFYPDPTGSGEFGLSDLQRETLLVALESGYFDVPRRVSQRELAEQLDASPTAVSQRLRRAVATLLKNLIAGQ